VKHRLLAIGPLLLLAVLLAGCVGTPSPGASGRACLAELSRHDIDYRPVEVDNARDPRCTVDAAVRVRRIEAALNRPATMSCGLASRLDEFEREVVQPAARSEFGERVARIDHLGAFSCRANTQTRGRFSEHAFGRAIDISGFQLADGTQISIARDWSASGPKRRFLQRIARGACRYFSVVLTPDSNADHYNHFHLDIGPGRSCAEA
jgi:hypothetical protein